MSPVSESCRRGNHVNQNENHNLLLNYIRDLINPDPLELNRR
ncbi:hypothetical protein MITS9508_02681 [Synechococcus sp. MIT S9508]|nr:hypothetical protein MITS9508_02681 [Synechococcus sp. MIT S9508]